MLQKILVPLDGSKLAECALPYAEEIAKGCNTKEVVLVSVTERMTGQTSAPELGEAVRSSGRSDIYGVGGQAPDTRFVDAFPPGGRGGSAAKVTITFGKKEKEAQRYLGKIVKSLEAKGIKAQCEVLIGNPAEEIAAFAEKNSADLIVMSSHGRSGPSRWTSGSVADKVFRASCVPVLMVRAPGCVIGI